MGKQEQFDLFGAGAYARNTDPGTSHEAANKVKAHMSRLEKVVYDCIDSSPDGLTTKEIAELTKIDRVTVSPRIKPLCNKLLIQDSGRRRGRSIIWVTARQAMDRRE